MKRDSDLSQFYDLMTGNPLVNASLYYTMATIFAPTNQAFQQTGIGNDKVDVAYHISNTPIELQNLQNSVPTIGPGNPPLWITRIKAPNGYDEIYVNNAKIIRNRSVISNNTSGQKQVLHVIDDILVPLTKKTASMSLYNPTALDLLTHSDEVDIGNLSIKKFRDRVLKTDKQRAFQADGKFTFFIPVDSGFDNVSTDKVDMKVVDGHVVPYSVLFTTPTPHHNEYLTLADNDMLKVRVSFSTQNNKLYVASNTILGDGQHRDGRVLVEILKANIPVKNGVVHLISSPLMIVDKTVIQFLEVFKNHNGPHQMMYSLLREVGGDLLERMNTQKELTIFVPNNDAWEMKYVSKVLDSRETLLRVLQLHIVDRDVTIDTIVNKNREQLFKVPTLRGNNQNLYFDVLQTSRNRTVTVEGGGVNATILTPDITATNGRIHIINRVLGVPYMNIAEKLKSDPMLQTVQRLGERTQFNSQLNLPDRKYTYFVPRDSAWLRAERDHPTALKKILRLTTFDYHVRNLLERHLVVSDKEPYTIEELRKLARAHSNDTFTLPSIRDSLRIKYKENEHGAQFEWQGEWVKIFRADVNCTNGIIHVIEQVLVTEADVRVTGAALSVFANFGIISAVSASLLFL